MEKKLYLGKNRLTKAKNAFALLLLLVSSFQLLAQSEKITYYDNYMASFFVDFYLLPDAKHLVCQDQHAGIRISFIEKPEKHYPEFHKSYCNLVSYHGKIILLNTKNEVISINPNTEKEKVMWVLEEVYTDKVSQLAVIDNYLLLVLSNAIEFRAIRNGAIIDSLSNFEIKAVSNFQSLMLLQKREESNSIFLWHSSGKITPFQLDHGVEKAHFINKGSEFIVFTKYQYFIFKTESADLVMKTDYDFYNQFPMAFSEKSKESYFFASSNREIFQINYRTEESRKIFDWEDDWSMADMVVDQNMDYLYMLSTAEGLYRLKIDQL